MILDYWDLLSLEKPLFLIIAFLPFLFMLFKQIKIHSLTKYAEKQLWPWSINISEQHFKSRTILNFGGWLFIAIALSGPQLPGLNKSFSTHNRNIKSDISIMLIADVNGITSSEYNSYLIQLSDFLDSLNGEKIGFIALSSSSALISPITNDYLVSHFYLKQMFNVITLNPRLRSNDLNRSLEISLQEIRNSNSNSAVIIYWSDYLRNKISSKQLIKTKMTLELIQDEDIKVISIWNNSNEIVMNSNDISEIFGNSSEEFINLTLDELYEKHLYEIKSLVLFDSNNNFAHQQLYSYPLVLGFLLLLLSFIPVQIFNRIRHES